MGSVSDFDGGEPVYRFSRAKAIAEGVLVDLSGQYPDLVERAGIAVPVALTVAAFEAAVSPIIEEDGDAADLRQKELLAAGERFETRAFRVLHTYAHSVSKRRARPLDSVFSVAVTVLHVPGHYREIDLWCIASLGDEGEPVLTVTLPDEQMPSH